MTVLNFVLQLTGEVLVEQLLVFLFACSLFQIFRKPDAAVDELLDIWNIIILGNVDANSDPHGEGQGVTKHMKL